VYALDYGVIEKTDSSAPTWTPRRWLGVAQVLVALPTAAAFGIAYQLAFTAVNRCEQPQPCKPERSEMLRDATFYGVMALVTAWLITLAWCHLRRTDARRLLVPGVFALCASAIESVGLALGARVSTGGIVDLLVPAPIALALFGLSCVARSRGRDGTVLLVVAVVACGLAARAALVTLVGLGMPRNG
jgi:hypothetical protein